MSYQFGNVRAKERPRKVVRRKHEWGEDFTPYDWKLAHSNTQVDVFCVLGARTTGKTYGLRLEFIENYWKKRERFCEIVRNDNELADFQRDYFKKIDKAMEFPDLVYKVENNQAFIAKRPETDEETPDWELAGYFVSLSKEQKYKKLTYDGVVDFNYDEAVLDRSKNRRLKYLPDEYSSIVGIMNTVLRETPNERVNSRLHLLGNACDLTCPLFASLGVKRLLPIGKTFLHGRRVMIDRIEPRFSTAFREQTTVGRMMGFSEDAGRDAGVFFDNEFFGEKSELLMKMGSDVRHMYNIVFGSKFGVWLDMETGLVHISKKAPNSGNTFAMVNADMSIDYVMVTRSANILKQLANFHRNNLLRYDDPMTQARFVQVLEFLGIR